MLIKHLLMHLMEIQTMNSNIYIHSLKKKFPTKELTMTVGCMSVW